MFKILEINEKKSSMAHPLYFFAIPIELPATSETNCRRENEINVF